MARTLAASTLALVVLLAAACGGASSGGTSPEFGDFPLPGGVPNVPPGDGTGPPPAGDLANGVLVTIDSGGEIWRWWVTNPTTAQALADVWAGTLSVISMGGTLRAGPGEAAHNAPWSWHVDPVQNGVDVITVPESPKTPSQCENMLSFWLSTGVAFIPPQATIIAFEDRR